MVETRPGAIVLLGNGSTAGVAHPAFQRRSPANGIGYWVSLGGAGSLKLGRAGTVEVQSTQRFEGIFKSKFASFRGLKPQKLAISKPRGPRR